MTDPAILLPACFAMNMTFGPNNLLALTHGAQGGAGFALRASVGRLLMFVPMIALSAAGLGLLLAASAAAFTAVKIAGAAYLIWIGVKILRGMHGATAGGFASGPAPTSAAAFRREALTAAGNPKSIVIFAAFFPQFIDQGDYWVSWLELGALFLALEAVAVVIYGVLGRFAARAAGRRLHWIQAGSGAGMILFGVLLLMARRPGAA